MDQLHEKVMRRAGIIRTIFSFLMVIYLVVGLIGTFVLFSPTTGMTINEPVTSGLTLFSYYASSVARLPGSEFDKQLLFGILILLYITLMEIVFYFTRKFFQNMALGNSPFRATSVRLLELIRNSLFVLYLLPMLVKPVLYYLFEHTIRFELTADTTLLIAIIVSLVVEIFRYGTNLQVEVDETV
ncbi:DUF2975 domain-containing protein [Enterococcus canis]|nr:DUF2975 domain-containing protein [Enterococcus canis]